MYLEIRGDRTIREIQQDFNKDYPFLKIEFFKNGLTRRDKYPPEKLIPGRQHIKEAWFLKREEGYLAVEDNMSVLDLEKSFMDRFALSVQVFRKAGTVWLETTLTDHWTLKQQNEHGREISVEKHKNKPEEYTDN